MLENVAKRSEFSYLLLLLLLLLSSSSSSTCGPVKKKLKKSVSNGRPRINTTDSDRLMQATKLGTLIQHNTNLIHVPNGHTRTLFVFDNAQSPGLSVCRDLLWGKLNKRTLGKKTSEPKGAVH